MARLTKRLLNAMQDALSAMLAGVEGEGDWPKVLPRRDLEDAGDWVSAQLSKRAQSSAVGREGATDA